MLVIWGVVAPLPRGVVETLVAPHSSDAATVLCAAGVADRGVLPVATNATRCARSRPTVHVRTSALVDTGSHWLL